MFKRTTKLRTGHNGQCIFLKSKRWVSQWVRRDRGVDKVGAGRWIICQEINPPHRFGGRKDVRENISTTLISMITCRRAFETTVFKFFTRFQSEPSGTQPLTRSGKNLFLNRSFFNGAITRRNLGAAFFLPPVPVRPNFSVHLTFKATRKSITVAWVHLGPRTWV